MAWTGSYAEPMRALLLLLVLVAAAPGTTRVAPNDARIRISGRALVAEDLARFDWAGTSLNFRLKGAHLRLLLDGSGPDFDVLVDGAPWTVLRTWGAPAYDLWLPDAGTHDVSIVRRQGPMHGLTRFAGLEFTPDSELLPAPPPPGRLIEFVGDSLTVGYGVEAVWPTCQSLRPFENATKAFAWRTAAALSAEASLVAASGHGVVRNFASPGAESTAPLPTFYERAAWSDATPWPAPRRADAVVVFLGTNDLSTEPLPSANAFDAGYAALLDRIRALHGASVPLFLLSDAGRPRLSEAVERVLAAETKAGRTVHGVQLPAPGPDWGCDNHPGATSQQRYADALTAALGDVLGWGPAKSGR